MEENELYQIAFYFREVSKIKHPKKISQIPVQKLFLFHCENWWINKGVAVWIICLKQSKTRKKI